MESRSTTTVKHPIKLEVERITEDGREEFGQVGEFALRPIGPQSMDVNVLCEWYQDGDVMTMKFELRSVEGVYHMSHRSPGFDDVREPDVKIARALVQLRAARGTIALQRLMPAADREDAIKAHRRTIDEALRILEARR